MTDEANPSPNRTRVWDIPTRVVHGLLVIGIPLAWWTAEERFMEWHRWCGYGLLGIILFRVYWGFFGGSTARFAQFIRGPSTVVSYVRGQWREGAGHNPLGALSVVALLGLLILQVTLGLFAVDVDGIESGPLSFYVSFDTGRAAAEWHETVFDALVWLIGLHIGAVVFYALVKKQPLIGAMVHGKRDLASDVEPLRSASALRFVIGVVIASAITWYIARGCEL